MKAITFKEFGPSSVLSVSEVPRPEPQPDEVLVKAQHAGVNPVDWKIREGYLQEMLPHELPIIPGWDVAGTVEAIGKDVVGVSVGESVYAYARKPTVQAGTYAEYVALPKSFVAKTPKNFTSAQAAAVPLAGLTAWQALHDLIKIQKDETILVTAGSGGVGSYAIQFAKLAGAKVVTTASAKNHSYVRELGADTAVDYTAGEVVKALEAAAPEGYDAVFDCAGGSSLEQAWSVIRSGGRLVSIVVNPSEELAAEKSVQASFHFVRPCGDQLREITALADAKKLQPPALEVRSVKDAAAVLDENQARHVRGKVVLTIDF